MKRQLIVIGAAAALAFAALGARGSGGGYLTHFLVSDGFASADHTDPNLVNAWGIAFNPTGPVWIADNGASVSTLYDGQGNIVPLVVQIPAAGGGAGGPPTGVVFNATAGFEASKGNPSKFIFAGEDGVISGWSPAVDPTHAVALVDNSSSGAVYKGIALAAGGSGPLLYATDFHNAKVDAFDATMAPVTTGGFVDPNIPAGFGPFGIQAINGDIFVTYAKQDDARHDDVKGQGLGFVDVFDANGRLVKRLISRGRLNAPWGLALAPTAFGKFGGRLLVGNFGDGTINVYDPTDGRPLGRLRDPHHSKIAIDGLWGLSFGNGFRGQGADSLYFTAGPDGESHGLYGRIDAVGMGDDGPDLDD
jgi:uncharacterized protein (TIGR03118 family)